MQRDDTIKKTQLRMLDPLDRYRLLRELMSPGGPFFLPQVTEQKQLSSAAF